MIGSLPIAFLAGILSTLSPCVLPLLPIVLGAAAGEHPWGPVALAAGLTSSYVTIGLFVASIGLSGGLDGHLFRFPAALVLLVLGLVLMLPSLQARLALATGPLGNWVEDRFGGLSHAGIGGQFAVGVLLGAVWSPCVGPTLGAASILAAQGRNIGQVALTMALFGIGAALPLLLIGMASRETLARWRSGLARAGMSLRVALGLVLTATAGAVLLGYDKLIETALVAASPEWLTGVTSSF